jgi:branched-chain amino acid transport system permease protein
VAIYKVTKVFNFAVGELVILGGLIAISIMNTGIPSWLGVLLAVFAMGLVGMFIEWGFMRQFIGKSVLTAMMVTAVFTYLVSGVSTTGWGGLGRPMPKFLPAGQVSLGPGVVGLDLLWSGIVVVVVFVAFTWLFQRTKVGLGMRITAEDFQAAASKGIKGERMYRMAWVVGGMTAALGGIFMGHRTGVEPSLALIGLKALPVVFLGGVDSVAGVLVGGLFIGIAEQMVIGYVGSEWGDFVPFLILLAVLAFRPTGIFGERRVERI